jgi:hypothetical protein
LIRRRASPQSLRDVPATVGQEEESSLGLLPVAGNGGSITLSMPTGGQQRFFRIVIQR